jgi:hypothetical protein
MDAGPAPRAYFKPDEIIYIEATPASRDAVPLDPCWSQLD